MARKIKVSEVTLPVYWASALVNGDYSGLSEEEAKRCRAKVAELAAEGMAVVDCARDDSGEIKDARFTWNYPLYDREAAVSGGEVLDYVVHIRD